jgi:flagellar basal body-associated protein FliL
MGGKLTDRPSDYTFGKRKARWPWIVGIGAIAIMAIGIGGYLVFRSSPKSDSGTNENNSPQPAESARRLDGVTVESKKANFLPLAVVVENHSSVRPQSGLSQAGVVYEALAEGGITRFLAIFATNGELEIGPVRSARPYFVQLAREYGGMFVHAGASPRATTEITNSGIIDFNQFYKPYNFIRVTGRPKEHSLFASLRLLELGRKSLKLKDEGIYESWQFKDDTPAVNQTAKNLSIDFSTPTYRVNYSYDSKTNTYLRSQGGAPSADKVNNQRLAPKNVVVMLTSSTLYDALRRNITVIGEGKALVFIDGAVIQGVWKKHSAEGRLQFLDHTGVSIRLNRGQTWVEVVDVPEKNVNYS